MDIYAQQDVDIVTMCLRALKALASYHYKETKDGNTGLGSHAAGHTDPNGVFREGILSRFLRTLLQFLLLRITGTVTLFNPNHLISYKF